MFILISFIISLTGREQLLYERPSI